MANKLMVQEEEAIRNLTALGWGIRRIARDLKVSRNTVRKSVRTLEPADPGPIAELILKSAPLLSPGSGIQTDPLSTSGKTGRQSLCFVHADWILNKESGDGTDSAADLSGFAFGKRVYRFVPVGQTLRA